MTRRVLVLAYYFPPLGGSGVQRVAKLVKYLPRYGWQPEVLTPNPGRYHARDVSLLHEVESAGVTIHRTRSLDPTRIGRGGVGAGGLSDGRRRVARALTGALFLPDNKIGWYPFALRAGRRLLSAQDFDVVYSTAPPFTNHLVAAHLAEEFRLPLVLDYRDDWLDNPHHTYPTRWHHDRHARLEGRALRAAACVTTINETIAKALSNRVPRETPVHIIPQGFDPADFDLQPAPRTSGKMRFVYTGLFYEERRPDAFLKALALALGRTPGMQGHIEALFAGRVPAYFDGLVDELSIGDVTRYVGYLPHTKAVALALSADVLWMMVGEVAGAAQISTGKLFEYVGSQRHILGLVPEGEAAEALRAYGCATVVPPSDVEAIARAIVERWEAWRAGTECVPAAAYLHQHDRIRIAEQVSTLFAEIVAPHART